MDPYNPIKSQGHSNLNEDASPSSTSSPSLAAPGVSVGSQASSSPTAITSTSAAPRTRRRNRMITSCLECRRRKLKCNKSHPCTNCVKFKRDCVFLAPALDQASQLKLTEIKEKVGSLERLLEQDVAKSPAAALNTSSSQERALPDELEDDLPGAEKDYLEPTPLAVLDAAYEVDGNDDDLLDLGIQLGKMRITERIGGFFRPKISQELQLGVHDESDISHADDEARKSASPSTPAVQLPPAIEWLKPGRTFIMPSSGFFFGSAAQTASLIDFLPSRLAADRLIKQYFTCVHPICQVVHRPSFEKEYEVFWDEVSLGIEPPNSVQAIVFSVMFSAVVSMDEPMIIRDFGAMSKEKLQENFKTGVETALARANFLRTTKIEILQAFVMYLIPLCRDEVSRAHSVLVGAAIRMAECMGLHRDGETYGMNPLETHVRRLIWHQLCFLDIRTCEAQGPRPTIRRDEFDTKLPLNIDDINIHASGKPPVSTERFCDSTISLIRFELNEMIRTIWKDRPRIEQRKISLTAVLGKIEIFRKNMSKYDELLDDRIPLQRYVKIAKAIMMSKMHIMVLHRYHNSVKTPMPDRLLKIMVASGLKMLEAAITLETLPELHPWSWYNGAYQQYHTAFLLLTEVYFFSNRSKEQDRIWACIDYVYETQPSEDRRTKAKKILSELQQKTAIYQSMRGMRAPLQMSNHIVPQRKSTENINQNVNPNAKMGLQFLSPPQDTISNPNTLSSPIVYSTGLLPGVSGRVPILENDIQFAGIANGESLWAAVPQNEGSVGGSSENASVSGGQRMALGNEVLGNSATSSGIDDIMADIDWEAFDALFPPDQAPEMPDFTFNTPVTYFLG